MGSTVTRFPNGVTNVSDTSMFADSRVPYPLFYHTYLNDFYTYTAGDWVITATGSTTTALTAGDGGQLLLTNSAANNDLLALQKTPSAFAFTPGVPAWFRANFKINDALNSSMVMGLQVIDTTPLDVTDGIYFLSSTGSRNVSIICRKDATTGSTSAPAITTLADDKFTTLGWYYDGLGVLWYSVGGNIVGSLNVANFLPDTVVTVSFAVQNGAAAAKNMTVDYVYAQFARP